MDPLDLVKNKSPQIDVDGDDETKKSGNPLDLVKANTAFSSRVGSVNYDSESHDLQPGFQGNHLGDLARIRKD